LTGTLRERARNVCKDFRGRKRADDLFILDVSASQNIGSPGKTKIDIGGRFAEFWRWPEQKSPASLDSSAFRMSAKKFIKPAKGTVQAYQLIYTLAKLEPKSSKTNLNKAISFALNSIRRRAVIIMVSDFIDEGYQHGLKSLARRHDLVMIRISDKRETQLPKLGIIPVQDKESKKTLWVNTSFGNFRNRIASITAFGKKS